MLKDKQSKRCFRANSMDDRTRRHRLEYTITGMIAVISTGSTRIVAIIEEISATISILFFQGFGGTWNSRKRKE